MHFGYYGRRQHAVATDLINTLNVVTGRDYLENTARLASFAASHGIEGTAFTRAQLERVRRARTRLRIVFDEQDEGAAVELLNEMLAEAAPLPHLERDEDGNWDLGFVEPGNDPAAALIGAAALDLAYEIEEHGLDRIQTCAAEDCVDAFIDTTRNHSRRFCSTRVCGNRTAVRAYRARQSATSD